MMDSIWSGLPVFVTGHTGFKGGWLSLWLHQLGAKVHGYALDPKVSPTLFEVACVGQSLASDTRADLGDILAMRAAMQQAQPAVVFHLAAQPLVLESYRDPLGTLATNVMGTAHVLEVVRLVESVRAVVVITTDKVYQNRDWVYPYREVDPLGGHDPYSASKAAAEIVTASYRASFLNERQARPVSVATARAGNVVGGGDWALERLVPDCLRAFEKGEPVRLRYPHAVRPWQHVLEPLAGYLQLAERLLGPQAQEYACAWNFGPACSGNATVGEAVQMIARLWGGGPRVEVLSAEQLHESALLRLDITRACSALDWQPRWGLEQALKKTVDWHRAYLRGEDMRQKSLTQISEYQGAPAAAS